MGISNSKNDEDNEEQELVSNAIKQRSFATITSSIINGDNLSAYSGLKSETESVGESIDKANTASTLRTELVPHQEVLKDGKISTLFEWNEGGKIVYITGNFCSWTQFFIMSRKPNGTFQLVLDLPRGMYQYKFKVDNQWKYSTTAPTISDNEKNVNNIMDTTINTSTTVDPHLSSIQKEDILLTANAPPSQEGKNASKIKIKDIYGCYYPGKLELNTDAPGVPLKFYSHLFNVDLNTKQWIIGKKEFLHKVENNLLSENNSFKALIKCSHIALSHLIYQYNDPKNKGFEIVCQTSRLRHKMLSFVYYKPRKDNKEMH